MKDLNKIYDECKEIIEACGIPVEAPRPVLKVNKRAKGRWGQSRINHAIGYREINISHLLADDNADEFPIHNTMIHEMLHQECPNEGHGGKWKDLAIRVSKKTEFDITRTTTYEKYGVKLDMQKGYKYTCFCDKCKKQFGRSRLSQSCKGFGRRGELQHGGCGGRITIVQNW
jgi:hypothetical protein